MSVESFEAHRDRRLLEKSYAQIRACGWSVSVLADFGAWAIIAAVDGDDASGAPSRTMVIDPQRVISDRIREAEKLLAAGALDATVHREHCEALAILSRYGVSAA